MKKRIIAILLAVLMLLTACGKASDAPAPTEGTQPTSESTPTQSTDAPTEPEATEPTPAPTEPEPSKDDLSYYPYPLLDMTYGEIEALYGELTEKYYFGAMGSYRYIPSLRTSLTCGVPLDEEIPDNQKPISLIMIEPMDRDIFPGLNVGMKATELPKDLTLLDGWGTGSHDNLDKFSVQFEVDSCLVNIFFEIPEEVLNQYGTIDFMNDEEKSNFVAWGDEYRENIFSQDNEIVRISISLKRS